MLTMKGDKPVAELMRELWPRVAYSNLGHAPALGGVRPLRREDSKLWLARSACPLYCGWWPKERLEEVPRARQNAFQTCKVNWGLTRCAVGFHVTLKNGLPTS